MDQPSLPTESSFSSAALKKFEEDLLVKNGIDRLNTWHNYVVYMEEHQPNEQGKLINIMKRCLKHYKNSTKYNHAEKYVDIWLKFCGIMDEPDVLYQYMFDHKVGTTYDSLYKSWALYCAKNKSEKEALDVIELGKKTNSELCDSLEEYKRVVLCNVEVFKTKANISHKYYFPDKLTPPGTVLKYYKTKIYEESYEQSFEELKAKLSKYAKCQNIKEKSQSTTSASIQSNAVYAINLSNHNVDDNVEKEDTSDDKMLAKNILTVNNIEEDEAIQRNENERGSLSFIEKFESPNWEPGKCNYAAILDDLDSTRSGANFNICKPRKIIALDVGTSPICVTTESKSLGSREMVNDQMCSPITRNREGEAEDISSNLKSQTVVIDDVFCDPFEDISQSRTPSTKKSFSEEKEYSYPVYATSPAVNNSITNIGTAGNPIWAPSPSVTLHTKGALKSVFNMFTADLSDERLDMTNTSFGKQFDKTSQEFTIYKDETAISNDTELKGKLDNSENDPSFGSKFTKKRTGVTAFEIFKDITEDDGKNVGCDRSDISPEEKFSKKSSGVPAFEIFKDITEDDEKKVGCDQSDISFEEKFSKKFNGVPRLQGLGDVETEDTNQNCLPDNFGLTEDLVQTETFKAASVPNACGTRKSLLETEKKKLFEFDITLSGTPGMPSYESTSVIPLKRLKSCGYNPVKGNFRDMTAFNNEKYSNTINDVTCTIDLKKIVTEDKSPLTELVTNQLEERVNKMSPNEMKMQKTLESQKAEFKKELFKENIACPIVNTDEGAVENITHEKAGFVSVCKSNYKDPSKKVEYIDKGLLQLKQIDDLCNLHEEVTDIDFCSKKFSDDVNPDTLKHCNPILGSADAASAVETDNDHHMADVPTFSLKRNKRRSSCFGIDELNLLQKVKKTETNQFCKDLSNFDEENNSSDDTTCNILVLENTKSPQHLSNKSNKQSKETSRNVSADKFKSIFLEDEKLDCFKKDHGDDEFERMFQRESKGKELADCSLFRKKQNIRSDEVCKTTDNSFPGYFINDGKGINEQSRRSKIRNESERDEDMTDYCGKPLKRLISTPSSPSHNQHCFTFGQQISELSMKVNFEKTETFSEDSEVKLSPIVERSNEDSKESSDGTRHSRSRSESGDDNDDSRATNTLRNKRCHNITIGKDQLRGFVTHVLPILKGSPNVIEMTGPLPRLKDDSMILNIGTRNVRVVKCIKKHDSYSIYRALIEERQEVSIKCLTKDSNQFFNCVWDVYISNEIYKRVSHLTEKELLPHQDKSLVANFLRHNIVYMFEDSVYIESIDHSEGTVMDTINLYKKHGEMMDESLVLLYAYEILNIISTLHKVNILHGNLRPEIFLQIDSVLTEKGPLALHSIMLTEFNESIDLTLIPDHEKVMLVSSDLSNSYPCLEMKEQKPWKYQVDYYAAAATIHLIAFQTEMEIESDSRNSSKRIKTTIPSYWNTAFWEFLFHTLINTSAKTANLVILISKLVSVLSDQKMLENLKEARLRTTDLCMDDDDDF